ncbi:hypothetical protein AB5I41_14780 [Sphingomonas sp. MMS24-JH45]
MIAICGSATTNQGILFELVVGLDVDNVYVGKAYGSVFDLPDIERVEARPGAAGHSLRPQHARGAASIAMRKPSDTLRVEGEASVGNLDYRQFKALVNLPFSDTLFVKATGQVRKRDGFTRYRADPLGIFDGRRRGGRRQPRSQGRRHPGPMAPRSRADRRLWVHLQPRRGASADRTGRLRRGRDP